MKFKFICLLAMLFAFNLAASPNRNCNGIRCGGQQKTSAAPQPATLTEKITDDGDLLPNHYLLNGI